MHPRLVRTAFAGLSQGDIVLSVPTARRYKEEVSAHMSLGCPSERSSFFLLCSLYNTVSQNG
jgi:hypothetical protein